MQRPRQSFWQRSRNWPVIGQLAFATVVILIAGAISGGVASAFHGASSPKGADRTTTVATTPPTRHALPSAPRRGFSAVSTAPITGGPVATVPPRRTPTTVAPSHSLLSLTIASPSHGDTYDRAVDFGGFIDVDGCKDTRAEVLIRTSPVPVSFTTSDNCTVKSGRWTDPWSGITTTVAHDFQVDHTVPLANAWTSGAWSWTHAQRVAYANDLTDTDHLVPILTHENESKNDKGPDGWKPPSSKTWCRYALVWDHIKAKWHLSATQAEWGALLTMTATC